MTDLEVAVIRLSAEACPHHATSPHVMFGDECSCQRVERIVREAMRLQRERDAEIAESFRERPEWPTVGGIAAAIRSQEAHDERA